MQEFINTDSIKSTFISLTGYRTMLIYKLLWNGPKTLDEIKNFLMANKYLGTSVSYDTIRNDINSLRNNGCQISKATKATANKFVMTYNPVCFDIEEEHLKVLRKAFKRILLEGSVEKLEKFENIIKKMIAMSKSLDTKDFLHGLLLINKINEDIYRTIKFCCKNKKLIKIKYEAPNSGIKEFKLCCQNIIIRSDKLYVEGYNLKYKINSFLPISRIKEIHQIENYNKLSDFRIQSAVCEIYERDFKLQKHEKLLRKETDKIYVEFIEKDGFRLLQKILGLGKSCKVLTPKHFIQKVIKELKEMKKYYEKS